MPRNTSKTRKQPATRPKPAPKARATNEWSDRLARPATRKAIARLVEAALMHEEARLDPKLDPAAFASRLVGFAPRARAFLPAELTLDEKLVKSTAKEFKALLTAEQPKRPKDEPGPLVAAMIVALVSRGVKSLEYFYAGGWDSVSPIEDGPTVAFLTPPSGGTKGAAKATVQLVAWLKRHDPAFSINEIMYRLLDDSGAGPPEYSQHFLIELTTGKLRKYGWARDRYE